MNFDKYYNYADNLWKSVPEGSWNTCKSNSGTTANIWSNISAWTDSYTVQFVSLQNTYISIGNPFSPGEKGLPIEIYVFCRDTNWTAYESVQADIFDHILAVVPEFDLQVFQEPSGTDFQKLSSQV